MKTTITFRAHLLSMRFWRWLETAAKRRLSVATSKALREKRTLDLREALVATCRR